MRFVRRLLHCGLEAVVSLAGNMAGLRIFRVPNPDRGAAMAGLLSPRRRGFVPLLSGLCPAIVKAPSSGGLKMSPIFSLSPSTWFIIHLLSILGLFTCKYFSVSE